MSFYYRPGTILNDGDGVRADETPQTTFQWEETDSKKLKCT